MSKKVLGIIMLALIIAVPTFVMASYYQDTITLGSGGLEKTTANKYTKGKFQVTYDVDNVFIDSYARKADFGLTKNTLLGQKVVNHVVKNIEYHTRSTADLGNQSAGTYFYQVAARSNAFAKDGPDETYAGFVGRLYMESF